MTAPTIVIAFLVIIVTPSRGLLEMVDFERRVIPTFGLEEVVVDKETDQQLSTILHTAKTHKFISSQWGFTTGKGNVASAGGVIVLVSAPPRSGKTTIGLALAYELGQPVKVSSCTAILLSTLHYLSAGGELLRTPLPHRELQPSCQQRYCLLL